MARGHSNSMFTWNFIFLTPSPLVCPCSFYMYPHQGTFTLLSYCPSEKKFCNAYKFLNEKSRSENREKNFFVDSKDKTLMLLHSHMCNDNKNIYMFIKKTINGKKEVYSFLIKNHLYMAGLGSKQNNF